MTRITVTWNDEIVDWHQITPFLNEHGLLPGEFFIIHSPDILEPRVKVIFIEEKSIGKASDKPKK